MIIKIAATRKLAFGFVVMANETLELGV